MCSFPGIGQDNTLSREKVYHMNYKIDIPVTAGLIIGNYFGFQQLMRKPELTPEQISFLDINEVGSFDRSALKLSPSNMYQAQSLSDWGRNITLLLPALLFIDKQIRDDWLDVSLLYMETQAVNLGVHLLAGPLFTNRVRPFVYYPEIPLENKMTYGSKDSWFSGHTSSTAAASFFMAKVYSDYHPELGNKKFWLFAAALVPPAFVGFNRYMALKHFPKDVVVGTAVGAAIGILIPHFHKITKQKVKNLTIVPFTGKQTGVALSLKL